MKIDVELTPEYWDCECVANFIHRKSETLSCEKCNSIESDQPDSHVLEVGAVL